MSIDEHEGLDQEDSDRLSSLRESIAYPTAVLTSAGVIDIGTLEFRSYLPESLIRKLSQHSGHDILEAERKEREARERETDNLLDLSDTMLEQFEIDHHRITLHIGGKAVEMTQGELRKKMEERLEELRDQRERLLVKGANADDILALDTLIDRYETSVTKLADGKIGQDGIKDIEDLIEDDPEFGLQLEEDQDFTVANGNQNETASFGTSYSAGYFGDGSISGPPLSLTETFAQNGSPVVAQAETNEPVAPDTNKKLDKLFDSYGI